MLSIDYTSTGTKESPSYTCDLVFDEGGRFASATRKAEAAIKAAADKGEIIPHPLITAAPPAKLQLASISQIDAETEYGPVRCWEANVSMNSTIPDTVIRDRTLTQLKAKIERAVFERIGGAAPQEPLP